MKKFSLLLLTLVVTFSLYGQGGTQPVSAPIHEFDLANGLHVIISPDSTSPIVCVGMMYHVGSKNENPDRTGFAHLFEHLLFFGTKNIPEHQLELMIRSAGGYSNASTSADRTYYYTIFPANQYRLGLWIESERMYHPIMTQAAIDREREVVKEESRQRYDGTPLGRSPEDMTALEYETCPYRWPVIGSMEHLDAANLDDFEEFFKKFYVPNNACLVLTGNVDIEDAKKYIDAYFSRIPRGEKVIQPDCKDKGPGGEVIVEKTLEGIDKPHVMISYATAPQMSREAKILEFLSAYLKFDESSLFTSADKQKAAGIDKIGMSAEFYEKAGSVWLRVSYQDSLSLREVLNAIDAEFTRLEKGVDPQLMARTRAVYESSYVDMYYDPQFLGESLGLYHFLWGDAREINKIIPEYVSVTSEEVVNTLRKFMIPGNRRIIVYRPLN